MRATCECVELMSKQQPGAARVSDRFQSRVRTDWTAPGCMRSLLTRTLLFSGVSAAWSCVRLPDSALQKGRA